MDVIRLGLLLPSAKKKKLNLPERIKDQCKQGNIEIIDIDFYRDLDEQGPFDVLIHKVVDYHKESSDYMKVEMLINNVIEYAKRNPQMYVVDDFNVINDLMSRKAQFELLQKCSMTVEGINVYIPKSLEISENTSHVEFEKSVSESGIKFPVLAKPLASCLKGAHDIMIVFDEAHLTDVPVPCLLQEFCNHGGVIYKVFVIGDQINFCERPSIQDVDCSSSQKSLVFDTREVSKTGKPFIPELHGTDPNLRKWLSCHEKPDMLNKNVLIALHKRINELTGLQLYGLDILIDKNGNYAVVDLNHFPGYDGLQKGVFPKNLIELIKRCAKKS